MKYLWLVVCLIISTSTNAQTKFTGTDYSGIYDCTGQDKLEGCGREDSSGTLLHVRADRGIGVWNSTEARPAYWNRQGSACGACRGRRV